MDYDPEEIIDIHIKGITRRQAEYLSAAACDQYHRFKATYDDETYGALINDKRVLDAREAWNKIEEVVGVNQWVNPQQH